MNWLPVLLEEMEISMTMLDWAVLSALYTGILLAIADILMRYAQTRYAKGTHPRYVLATWRVVTNTIETSIVFGLALYWAFEPNYVFAVMYLILTACLVVHMYLLWQDDNWFNDRWKRIKKWAHKLSRVRLHLSVSQPSVG